MEIIIGILLINVLQRFIGSILGLELRKGYFACGLVAFNGEKAPNPDKMKILWMYNLGRGDDSCGIFWDGLLKKGVGTKANVFNFLEATRLPEIKKYFTVIGHTRKSTVGSHSEENAHPFGFYTKEMNKEGKEIGLQNVVPFGVGAHNGVIRNREELRTKYGAKYNYNVDSIELLNIIIDSKLDPEKIKVLENYEGYAALLWTFPNENKLFVFRGKSAIGEDTTGERPLFYWKKRGEKAVYISSIKESLMTICDDEDKEDCIKSFDTNKIYCIEDGQISTLKVVINREGKGATAATPTPNTSAQSANSSTNKKHYKDVFIGYPEKTLKKVANIKERDSDGSFFLTDEPYYNPYGNDRVIFTKGRYFKNGHILGQKLKEGIEYLLDDNGYPPSSKHYNKTTSKAYFFWNGWMVKDKESLKWLCEKYIKNEATEKVNGKVQWKMDFIFRQKFCTLTLLFDDDRVGGYYGRGGCAESYFTGKFEPAFNQNKIYDIASGYFKKATFLDKIEEVETEEILEDTVQVAITDADVDMSSIYINAMNSLLEASDTIADPDFNKDPDSGIVPPVTEDLRQKFVKWLDEAWRFLDENITEEERGQKEEREGSETALVY